MVEITAAAVRLFNRALVIQSEVEDQLDDDMTYEELIARSDRVLREWEEFKNNPDAEDEEDDEEDEEKKAVRAALAKHREYQWVKAELGKQLRLQPDDINPLDLTFDSDPEWTSPDDPGIAIWKRAIDIYRRLSEAHLDWLLWWRPKKASSGNVIPF
jgi:hypothetical protein